MALGGEQAPSAVTSKMLPELQYPQTHQLRLADLGE
jgi:hypothetical protein